ncbi:MAG: PPOX class F420-dependent oxidoreductase [Chloroflexi bacterium]|nr:PPOX class F420-dependent oxidoreductase [Chloroflexota bacterium]
MSFTAEEIEYLRSQPLARFATLSGDGQPDVVPVSFEFDGTYFWIGGSGRSVFRTRKFRNATSGNNRVALVVDDMVSFDPFIARGIRVYGKVDGPIERVGIVGPGAYLRIAPTISWAWNVAGGPVGESWYPARRALHKAPGG